MNETNANCYGVEGMHTHLLLPGHSVRMLTEWMCYTVTAKPRGYN